MVIEFHQVDAFARRPFEGNPAAVVPLEQPVDPAWAACFAAEMNLSETAFLWPEGDWFRLRWWTPAAEVRLCGHATLAAAHTLWETGRLAPEAPALFETLSGRLVCRRRSDGRIEMEFPALASTASDAPEALVRALGVEVDEFRRSDEDVLVVLATESEVRALTPDLTALSTLDARGTIVTAIADEESEFDFVSRFFAPRFGVPEDPVTGSAHCVLAPYWCRRLGREALAGYQASRRGGHVDVRLAGDRVVLTGTAVTVASGSIREIATRS